MVPFNETLTFVTWRADDGYRIISVRIREDTLAEIDRLASETNHSRNELINLILAHGVKHIEIE